MSTVLTKEENKTKPVAVRKEPMFVSLQHEMNRLFDEFRQNLGFSTHPWTEALTEYATKVDVKDNDNRVVVTMEIPGVDMKDIELSMRGDGLVVKGEKKEEKEEKEKGYYRIERTYGSFYRMIPIPCEVDRDNVEATYKDGVLKVTLPKTKETLQNEKKISVKAG